MTRDVERVLRIIYSDRRIIWFGHRIIDSVFYRFLNLDSWFGFGNFHFKIRIRIRIRFFFESWFGFDSDSIYFQIMIRFGFGFGLFWNYDSDSDSDSVKKRIISNHMKLPNFLNLLKISNDLIRFYSKLNYIFEHQ